MDDDDWMADPRLLLTVTEASMRLKKKLHPECNCDIGYTCDYCFKKYFKLSDER